MSEALECTRLFQERRTPLPGHYTSTIIRSAKRKNIMHVLDSDLSLPYLLGLQGQLHWENFPSFLWPLCLIKSDAYTDQFNFCLLYFGSSLIEETYQTTCPAVGHYAVCKMQNRRELQRCRQVGKARPPTGGWEGDNCPGPKRFKRGPPAATTSAAVVMAVVARSPMPF